MPRTIKLAVALLLACGLDMSAADAQERGARPPTQAAPAADTRQTSKAPRGAKARARSERARSEKRRAVALLLDVGSNAREIEALYQRASILASCADALWEADQQSARSLFSRAWETATESDDAELKEEQTDGRYGDLPERFTRARDLALTTVARRDARMAETFLRSLVEWLGRQESSARGAFDDSEAAASRNIGPLNEFTQSGQRLLLAFSLLDEETYKSAVAVAEPALAEGVSGILVEFLLRLREQNADVADGLFLRLLERTRTDARSDANDVLLLSSYVLTPRLLAVVDRRGSIQFRTLDAPSADGAAEASASSRRARAAFFDAAVAILLRPAQAGTTPTGGDTVALYFAAGRLLPFFEREAPQLASALRTRLSSLAAEIEAARRDSLDSQMKLQRLTPENTDDPLRKWLDMADATRDNPKLRDSVRLSAATEAAKRKLWDRARRLADEIENEESRQAARFIIGARQITSLSEAFADGNDDDFEKAASFARQVELSPVVSPALRAYGLAEAAELAARRGKRARAIALLDEAFSFAQQAENRTSPRAAATLMVAITAARVDSPRVWETLVMAVAALNEGKEFPGNFVQFGFDGVKYFPGEQEALHDAFRSFTVEELFDEVARKDLERAVAEARNLKNSFSRALALVAAARAAIEKGSGA
ncbi:MAG: hypothetical protein LC802_07920 [Acidobacteria bacterium]|nr:hypothetical protein [Acidobacteriota bacterium]